MSLNININKMSYNGRSYADRAEAEKRKINRILSVREKSSELSQKLLKKTRSAKEQELKKLQQIKQKELSEWKKRTQCEIEKQIDNCAGNFGDAHIAAVDASCEEDELLRDKRDEQDLLASMRGRVAMLQVQRERERELESKLLKKKRQQQKTVGIQADFLTQRRFSENLINNQRHAETDMSEEEGINDAFTVKPNPHKHSEQYNPQNYTSNSVDSSNNCDSDSEGIAELEEDESVRGNDESEVEFNQISNLIRQRQHNNQDETEFNEIINVGSSDSESISYSIELPKKVTIKASPNKKKRGILKKSSLKHNSNKSSSPVKSKKVQPAENRVRYVDFSNKYETTYAPDKNLIVRNEKSKTNARQNAQIQTDDDAITKKINDDVLKQLTDLRSQEALEKEKIRRDYERLRLELDELSKQEQEAKSKSNMNNNLTRDQLLRKEDARQKKMNEAAENAMKKNIITCPPVDRNEKSMRQKLSKINVAAPSTSSSSRDDTEKDKSAGIKLTRSNSEINNLVKIEKLKDLLEKINHQKRLLLHEIEKSEEIPGPDLEKVMDCIKKLEQEKAALNSDNKIDESKLKKIDELNEREKKIQEREKRLENNLRELFKKQQAKDAAKSSSSNSEQTMSDESSSSKENKNAKKIVQPPVEIIIKVQQPKSPHKKSRKSYRCIDTLSREPGKIYPKTPIKKKKSIDSDIEIVENESQKLPEKVKSQQQTQTSPSVMEPPKPILKNSQLKQISIPPKPMSKESTKTSKTSSAPKQKQAADSEDFSVSTVYRELPQQINLVSDKDAQRKLNPMLMDYITRVLGMNKNIGSQLNIDVSSVTTPGSSTINTTGNRSSNDEISFDQDRMNRLQKFIDDNHSFISEINESLERVEVQKKHDKDQEKLIEGIWREILSKKKPRKTTESQSKISSNAKLSKPTALSNFSSKKTVQQPQLTQKEQPKPKKSTTEGSQKTIPSQTVPTQHPRITQEDMADVSKYLESQMLNNYAEYTANCQRRIAELTQMMDKVRQEKLKLIENSLSSNELNNFTEYKDIVHTTAAKENTNGSTETKDSPSNRDDPPSEEINNILQFQTRPFGVSKDSGISVSRPVTSSDFRDTPPDRVTTSEDNNLFQPILKDIPKLPRMKITTSDGETQTIKDVSLIIKQQQDEKKKQRPPLSLKSPQFEKQQHEPHELSTIAEIETPTASKVNIQEEISGVGTLHTFPNFEEYAKNYQNNEASFPDLNDLMKALPDLNIKTFVEQEGLCLVDFTKNDENDEQDIQSTDSSLMDIMGEMKKRNLLESSFHIHYEDENNDNLLESGLEKDDKTTPTATNQMTQPSSPRKKGAQSRIIMKTPEDTGRIEVIHTPIKEKHHGPKHHEEKSLNSNDTLSGIQEIERDFIIQGMGWAASTMKKTEASQKQAASSSSSDNQDSIKINLEFDYSSTSSDGKPLNLRDFLRRELLTRSRNDPYLSDDSSISSKFIKSLLKASHSSSSTSSNDPKSDSSQNAKLRTSTPVRMSSENLVKTGASSQIFNGADSVSTVKDSDSSKDKSDKSKSL